MNNTIEQHLDNNNGDMCSNVNLDNNNCQDIDSTSNKTADNLSEHNIDNISTASSPHQHTGHQQQLHNSSFKDEEIKQSNSSILSSSSSSSSSSGSPSLIKSHSNSSLLKFGSAEWYKQYEDNLRLFNHQQNQQHQRSSLAGLHNFIKPNQINQSSPIQSSSSASSTSSSDSSILMERFYSQLPITPGSPFTKPVNDTQADKLLAASHQALLAQYAQQFYGQNHLAAAMASIQQQQQQQQHSDLIEKERERYLSGLNFGFANSHPVPNPLHFGGHPLFNSQRGHESPRTPLGNNSSNTNTNTSSQKDAIQMARMRGNSSGNSRSPSPSSSQHSAQIDCEEDEENCGDDSQSINAANGEWTYEEQFKQLYELSDDVKRKEFLDDLFSFMQKRGSPVNRIPIMAKHVLDLYELYRLVVSKGGLVEVINKKLWREITKGLNLPSSITSAAFTLRTQYMKYLYPYECEKLKMSTPGELQAAIDGNRREGRRPVYGYDYASPTGMSSSTPNQVTSSQNNSTPTAPALPTNPLAQIHHHQSASHPLLPHPHQNPHHHALLAAAAVAAAAAAQQQNQNPHHAHLNHHTSNHLPFEHQNHETPSQHSSHPLSHPHPAQHHHHHHNHHPQIPTSLLPPFLKPYFEMNTPPSSASSNLSTSSANSSSNENTSLIEKSESQSEANTFVPSSSRNTSIKRPFEHIAESSTSQSLVKEPSSKKASIENSLNSKCEPQFTINSNKNKMNIKIFSKESAEMLNLEKSLAISLEFNGLTYQGTLFATRMENNSGIQIQIPLNNNINTADQPTSAFISKKAEKSDQSSSSNPAIKADLVY